MKYTNFYKKIFLSVVFCTVVQAENDVISDKKFLFEVLAIDAPFTQEVKETLENILIKGCDGIVTDMSKEGSLAGFVSDTIKSKEESWKFFKFLSNYKDVNILADSVLKADNNTRVAFNSNSVSDVPVGIKGTIDPVIIFAARELSLNLDIVPLYNDDGFITIDMNVSCHVNNELLHKVTSILTVKSGDIIVLGAPYGEILAQNIERKYFLMLRVSSAEDTLS